MKIMKALVYQIKRERFSVDCCRYRTAEGMYVNKLNVKVPQGKLCMNLSYIFCLSSYRSSDFNHLCIKCDSFVFPYYCTYDYCSNQNCHYNAVKM